MTIELVITITLTCALGAMSPGPSLMCVLQQSLKNGSLAGVKASIAHGFGVSLWAVMTIAGVSALIASEPTVYRALVFGGSLYLIYIGVCSIQHSLTSAPFEIRPERKTIASDPLSQGFLIAFLNPKLAIFFIALFSQFVNADLTYLDKAIMVLIAGGVDVLWYALVSTVVSTTYLKSQLTTKLHLIDFVGGIVFILVGIHVILTRL